MHIGWLVGWMWWFVICLFFSLWALSKCALLVGLLAPAVWMGGLGSGYVDGMGCVGGLFACLVVFLSNGNPGSWFLLGKKHESDTQASSD